MAQCHDILPCRPVMASEKRDGTKRVETLPGEPLAMENDNFKLTLTSVETINREGRLDDALMREHFEGITVAVNRGLTYRLGFLRDTVKWPIHLRLREKLNFLAKTIETGVLFHMDKLVHKDKTSLQFLLNHIVNWETRARLKGTLSCFAHWAEIPHTQLIMQAETEDPCPIWYNLEMLTDLQLEDLYDRLRDSQFKEYVNYLATARLSPVDPTTEILQGPYDLKISCFSNYDSVTFELNFRIDLKPTVSADMSEQLIKNIANTLNITREKIRSTPGCGPMPIRRKMSEAIVARLGLATKVAERVAKEYHLLQIYTDLIRACPYNIRGQRMERKFPTED